MLVYIFLLMLMLFMLLIRNSNVYKYWNIIFIFFIIALLFILCVFRSTSVGSDYGVYAYMFYHETYRLMVSTGTETGFAHLVVFSQNMNNLLIISAVEFIIGIIAILLVRRRFCVNNFTLLSFFVITGLYFQMFTALRQMIAISIVYIGIYFLLKSRNHFSLKLLNILLFLLSIIIARKFHMTAIFAIIFLILPNITYGKKTIIISGIFTVVLFLSGIAQDVASFLITKTPHYNAKYLGSMNNQSSFIEMIIEIIPVIIQFIFLYYFVLHNRIINKKDKFILSGYLLYLVMFMGLNNNSIRRLQLYTLVFPILYSCLFLDGKKEHGIDNMPKTYRILYIIFWVVVYIGKLLITDRFDIIPYSFI